MADRFVTAPAGRDECIRMRGGSHGFYLFFPSDGVWTVARSQNNLLIILVQCSQESREGSDILSREGNSP